MNHRSSNSCGQADCSATPDKRHRVLRQVVWAERYWRIAYGIIKQEQLGAFWLVRRIVWSLIYRTYRLLAQAEACTADPHWLEHDPGWEEVHTELAKKRAFMERLINKYQGGGGNKRRRSWWTAPRLQQVGAW